MLEQSYLFALQHTGRWDLPVTLYIDSRPREGLEKRRWERGEVSHKIPLEKRRFSHRMDVYKLLKRGVRSERIPECFGKSEEGYKHPDGLLQHTAFPGRTYVHPELQRILKETPTPQLDPPDKTMTVPQGSSLTLTLLFWH